MGLKIAENQKELNSYIKFQVTGRKEVSIILFSDTLMSFIEDLKSYGRTLRNSSISIESDEDIYVITKYLNDLNQECLMIEPLYQFNSKTEEYEPIYVKDEFVLIEEYVLDEDEIKDIVKSDEYEIIGLIEDHPELEEEKCECYQCENCADRECSQQLGGYIKDNTHIDSCGEDEEFIECDTLEELIDVYTSKILETEGCPGCIHDIIEELCYEMIEEGIRQEALRRYNEDNERLFGDEGLLN